MNVPIKTIIILHNLNGLRKFYDDIFANASKTPEANN